MNSNTERAYRRALQWTIGALAVASLGATSLIGAGPAAAGATTQPSGAATASSAATSPTATNSKAATSTPSSATPSASASAGASASSARPTDAPSKSGGSVRARTLAAPAAPQSIGGTGPNLGKATSYLVAQLVDGNHLANAYGPDYGLTADLAIALASTGTQDAALSRAAGYLAAHVADYADPAGTSSYPGPYSGAAAKLALVAEITGHDPGAFGGFDLLTTLTDHVCTAADSSGNCTAPGDFYQSFSTVSQALAVLALARGGVTPPAAAVSRLQDLQCSGGGFSSDLITAGQTCTPDVDTTSYALQALLLVPGAQSAAQHAAAYLAGAQQGDGGYVGAAGENANSTALAIQALTATQPVTSVAPPTAAQVVAAGQSFLSRLQNTNGGFGITTAAASDTRSTTQAVPALAGATLASVSRPVALTAPTAAPTSTPARTAPPAKTSASSAVAAVATVTSSASPQVAVGLAATGTKTTQPLLLALLLLLLGVGATLLGTRRASAVLRTVGRRRH